MALKEIVDFGNRNIELCIKNLQNNIRLLEERKSFNSAEYNEGLEKGIELLKGSIELYQSFIEINNNI